MYCTNCGDKLLPNAKFCQGCGHTIDTDSSSVGELPTGDLRSENTSHTPNPHDFDADPEGEKVDRISPHYRGVLSSISSYLIRHWNGQLSLAVSFWVNFIFVSFLVMLVFYGLVEFGIFSEIETALKFAKTYSVFTTFVLSPWQMVGTWRAAKARTLDTGKTLWPTVVMLVVILFALLRISEYFQGPRVI